MKDIMSAHGWRVPGQASESVSASLTGRSAGESPVPLRLVREGEWVRIVSVNSGRGFHDRLAGMGLRIGGRLEIVQNRLDGKVLLGHEGTRLFLGGGMAQKIQVVIVEGRSK